ncbi:ferredoxin:thioredoxin reductase [candidate division WOR-3 bacterium]|nr:ferredoxin:thioredoxin reductase [candidate division WOR-3 bacterium]
MELTDTDRANIERARKVGEGRGHVLNPDTKRARKIANLLAKNFAEFGKYYCPCKQSQPLDPARDTVCPCPDLDEEIARDGHCHCWLFFRKPESENGKPCEN